MPVLVRNSQSAIFKGLSSFWIRYFKDSAQLESIYAGAEQLFGQVYLDLMELLLSKSLTNIPIFKKEEYKLFIIQDDQISFTPAVRSFATRTVKQVEFTVRADVISPVFDEVSIAFVDLDSITNEDRQYFPYMGLYNLELNGKSASSPKTWYVVLHSNKTVVDAVKDFKAQVITNKPVTSVPTGVDATFILSLNEGEKEYEVTITAAERGTAGSPTSVASLVSLLQTKIDNTATPRVRVVLESDHIIFRTDIGNSLRVVSATSAAENLLFIRAFNFTIEVNVPLDLQQTLKFSNATNLQMSTSGFKPAGSEYRFNLGGPGIVETAATASKGTLSKGTSTISAEAASADTSFDGHSISFIDLANVSTVGDSNHFPQVGIYNNYVAGKSYHDNTWTVVTPSTSNIINGIQEVSSFVVTNKPLSTFTTQESTPVQFTLTYDNDEDIEITLTLAEQNAVSNIAGMVTLLASKISNSDIVVSESSGHIKFASTVKKQLRVSRTNLQASKLLHIKTFPFILSAIDTSTAAWTTAAYVSMTTVGYRSPVYKYPLASDKDKYLRHVKYMTNTLYDPSLVLEEKKHYRVEDGFMYFKSNPFELQNVAYRVVGNSRQLAFWMGDVLYDNTLLYERYGHRFVDRKPSSEAYKLLIRGMVHYYTNGPDLGSIASALNLVAGIPVVINNEEKVTAISSGVITTDKNTYEVPAAAEVAVSVGDTVNAFDVLVHAFKIEDYVNSAKWFDNFTVPESLMPGVPGNQRQLKAEVKPITVGDPEFIIGDENPVAEEFTTGDIPKLNTGSYPYATEADAYFVIQIPLIGKEIPTYIPTLLTSASVSVSTTATVLERAIRQVTCNAIPGDPATSIVIDSPTFFFFNGAKITLPLTTYTNLVSVASTLETLITTAFPTGGYKVVVNPLDLETRKKLVFLTPKGSTIDIHSPSPEAHKVLGIVGKTSYLGIDVSAVEDSIRFTDNSTTADVAFRMANITATALAYWKMQPMLAGSGDMVGEKDQQGRGQPNLAYQLFDSILKYNTFRVTFNISDVNVDADGLDDIVELVQQGRPKYVTPFLSPSHKFVDTYTQSETSVPFNDHATYNYAAHDNVAFETTLGSVVNLIFSSIEGVRIKYSKKLIDTNNDSTPDTEVLVDDDFVTLGPAGVTIPLGGTPTSQLRLDYIHGMVPGRVNHKITFAVQGNITDPIEQVRYSLPGIYNQGIQNRGDVPSVKDFSQTTGTPSAGNPVIYGVFPVTEDNMWISEPERIALNSRVTHMFIMDSFRPYSLTETGIGEGDTLSLSKWDPLGTVANDGDFTILNVSYGVTPIISGQNTSTSKVDVIWYENPNGVVKNNISHAADFASNPNSYAYKFKLKPGHVSKRWYITVPYRSDITPYRVSSAEEMLATFKAIKTDGSFRDDSEYFPFNMTVKGVDAPWTNAVGTKLEVVTGVAEHEDVSSIGERWQVTYERPTRFVIGASYYDPITQTQKKFKISPSNRIIGPDGIRSDSKYIGEAGHIIGYDNAIPNHTLGTPATYRVGDFSTQESQVVVVRS